MDDAGPSANDSMGDARAVFEACYRAYLVSDWRSLGTLLSEDVVLESPGIAPVVGRDAVLDYHRRTRTAFPDMSGGYEAVVGEGTVAGGRKTMRGTNTGPLSAPGGREIPPTGRSIEVPESDWMEVRDGRCCHHWIYYDRALLLQQLGVAPSG